MRWALILFLCSSAWAATTYVSQSGGVIADGSNCNGQTAVSIATFNGGTQTAGDIIWFDGAITTAPSLHGSGTSGNVITYNWCTGARISVAHGQIFNLNGNSWLLFNGGTACGKGSSCYANESASPTGYPSNITGIIEATANGSALASQDVQTQAFFGAAGSHDLEFKNLIVRNLYQHTSTTDTTSSADTGTFMFQCPFTTGCASGAISIHDSDLHDMGEPLSIQRGSTTTISFFNNEVWNCNWAIENSGNGTRTLYVYGNHVHDTKNWDTGTDAFHHNFLHNFMNVASDSLGLYFYNNVSDGDWGSCCATALQVFTETVHPANFFFFNNVAVQSCNSNTAPGFDYGGITSAQGATLYNNTWVGCATTSGNARAYDVSGTGVTAENGADQGFGQFVVVNTGATLTAFDYNSYGAIGLSGNSPWQCTSTSASTFANWQATSCTPDAHGQKVASLGLNSSGVPQAGAAVLGAGLNLFATCNGQANPGLGALCSDINGIARPTSGAWTAGAFQGTAASPTCTPGSTTSSSTVTETCTNPNSGTAVMCASTTTTPVTNGAGTACTTGTLVTTTFNVSSTATMKIVAGTSLLPDSSPTSYSITITGGAAGVSQASGGLILSGGASIR